MSDYPPGWHAGLLALCLIVIIFLASQVIYLLEVQRLSRLAVLGTRSLICVAYVCVSVCPYARSAMVMRHWSKVMMVIVHTCLMRRPTKIMKQFLNECYTAHQLQITLPTGGMTSSFRSVFLYCTLSLSPTLPLSLTHTHAHTDPNCLVDFAGFFCLSSFLAIDSSLLFDIHYHKPVYMCMCVRAYVCPCGFV